MLFLIATVVVFATCLWVLGKELVNKAASKLPYPPGPTGEPFFGNLRQLPDLRTGVHLDIKLLEWAKRHGPIFMFRIPFIGRMIVAADVELVKYIAITKNYPKSWTYKLFTPLFGERGMLVMEGKEWSAMRHAFNPGFGTAFLKDMIPIMAEKLQRMLARFDNDIQRGETTPTLERAQRFTSDVIVQIAYGED